MIIIITFVITKIIAIKYLIYKKWLASIMMRHYSFAFKYIWIKVINSHEIVNNESWISHEKVIKVTNLIWCDFYYLIITLLPCKLQLFHKLLPKKSCVFYQTIINNKTYTNNKIINPFIIWLTFDFREAYKWLTFFRHGAK